MKKSYWFEHDYNAANDAKILFLRQQLGMEGYGIYWFIVEQLVQAGGKLPLKVIPVLAMQSQTQESKVSAIINGYDLFQIEDDCFFSIRLNKHIEVRGGFVDYGKIGAEKRWGNKGDEPYNRKKALREAQKIENHTVSEWKEMLEFFNYKCVRCGEKGVIKDHILPLNIGGLDGINNIQPMCKKCNSSKGNDQTDYRLKYQNLPEKWLKNRGGSSPATAKTDRQTNKQIRGGYFLLEEKKVVFQDNTDRELTDNELQLISDKKLKPNQIIK